MVADQAASFYLDKDVLSQGVHLEERLAETQLVFGNGADVVDALAARGWTAQVTQNDFIVPGQTTDVWAASQCETRRVGLIYKYKTCLNARADSTTPSITEYQVTCYTTRSWIGPLRVFADTSYYSGEMIPSVFLCGRVQSDGGWAVFDYSSQPNVSLRVGVSSNVINATDL